MMMRYGYPLWTTAALLASQLAVGRAETDFSVTNTDNYVWNQTEWSLATNRLVQNQYQARLSLANG